MALCVSYIFFFQVIWYSPCPIMLPFDKEHILSWDCYMFLSIATLCSHTNYVLSKVINVMINGSVRKEFHMNRKEVWMRKGLVKAWEKEQKRLCQQLWTDKEWLLWMQSLLFEQCEKGTTLSPVETILWPLQWEHPLCLLSQTRTLPSFKCSSSLTSLSLNKL